MLHEARDETLDKSRAEQKEIDAVVDKLIPEYLQLLECVLENEFGRAIMRSVEMDQFAFVLRRLAEAASNRTTAITSNKRLSESRAQVAGIFRALIDVSRNKEESE